MTAKRRLVVKSGQTPTRTKEGMCARRTNCLHIMNHCACARHTSIILLVVHVGLCPVWWASEKFVREPERTSLWAQQAEISLDVRHITLSAQEATSDVELGGRAPKTTDREWLSFKHISRLKHHNTRNVKRFAVGTTYQKSESEKR